MKNSKYFVRSVVTVILLGLLFTGCGNAEFPDLTDDAIAFVVGEYIDKTDDGVYGVIEYEGRTYIPYGTLEGKIDKKAIDQCVGYTVQDEIDSSIAEDTDTRVYTLAEDPDHNFLMEYYIGSDLMNQPSFWRAADTKGADIKIPKYIGNLEYTYWENKDPA